MGYETDYEIYKNNGERIGIFNRQEAIKYFTDPKYIHYVQGSSAPDYHAYPIRFGGEPLREFTIEFAEDFDIVDKYFESRTSKIGIGEGGRMKLIEGSN